ncbi:hypothetical protein I6B53_04030 [Schaalia sp. 19OD2882]|uniref:hypothetical protein n=1 Tax=Schaalia sp. 19OD2882 TaxID=2794089 RepID=UPI001C1EA58D|nr:hypothetical protein [Schaalia sp. 19OD2882]QWW20268.1 hypothetical protein I6B53_04030 [Schaalia sp. 19OD2882]
MGEALVEVVIPVHREERPVERAVASVVGPACGAPGVARAVVACHNIAPSVFADRLAPFGSAVRIVECGDGIPSPAGPLNAGLDAVTTAWATCMGSDDHYEDGAVAAWRDHLARRDPDVLILPVLDERDGSIDVPPVRRRRLCDLDPVSDRLMYRTGPLMLVRTDLLRAHRIRMTEGLRTGEDLAYSAHVWCTAGRIDLLGWHGPCYVEGDDGAERITRTPFPLAELLAPPNRLATQEWVAGLDERLRTALAIRVLRRSVIPALAAHAGSLGPDLVDEGARAAARWTRLAPRACTALSPAEVGVLDALARRAAPDRVDDALGGLTRAPRWAKVLPSSPKGLLQPDTRLRHLVAAVTRPKAPRSGGVE